MKSIYSLLFIFGVAYGNDILSNFQNIPGFPGMPNLDDVANIETALKEKCTTTGGENAYKNLKIAVVEMQGYITKNFEFATIKSEITDARSQGAMDEVFKKYCDKKPEYMLYGDKVSKAIEDCLGDNEKPVFKLMVNTTDNIINFLCEKDGDRLGMFIAADGFECLNEKIDELKKCAIDVVSSKVPATFNQIPEISITKEKCNDYKIFQKCVITEMEKCSNPGSANIIDALFNFIYKLFNCKNLK